MALSLEIVGQPYSSPPYWLFLLFGIEEEHAAMCGYWCSEVAHWPPGKVDDWPGEEDCWCSKRPVEEVVTVCEELQVKDMMIFTITLDHFYVCIPDLH